MRKFLVCLLVLVSGVAFGQSSSPPISSEQVNYWYFPGSPLPSNYTTVQLALTASCAANAGYGQVVLQQGATPSDAPTVGGEATYTITGCPNVTIQDDRGIVGSSCYVYSNSTTYVQGSCSSNGSTPSGVVLKNPTTSQAVTQPAGTSLSVNTLTAGASIFPANMQLIVEGASTSVPFNSQGDVYISAQVAGSGYSGTGTCTVNGGTYTTQATCDVILDPATSGGGLNFVIVNAGSYAVAPTSISFSGFTGGSGASATIALYPQPNYTNGWPVQMQNLSALSGKIASYANYAVSGTTIAQLGARFISNNLATACANGSNTYSQVTYLMGPGSVANSLLVSPILTGDQAYAQYNAVAREAIAAGCRVWVTTEVPRGSTYGSSTAYAYEVGRQLFNQKLRGGVKCTAANRPNCDYDYLTDLGSQIQDVTDPNIFDPGGVHFNGSGQVYVANIFNQSGMQGALPGSIAAPWINPSYIGNVSTESNLIAQGGVYANGTTSNGVGFSGVNIGITSTLPSGSFPNTFFMTDNAGIGGLSSYGPNSSTLGSICFYDYHSDGSGGTPSACEVNPGAWLFPTSANSPVGNLANVSGNTTYPLCVGGGGGPCLAAVDVSGNAIVHNLNVEGSTTLNTSLSGCVTATSGVISASGTCGSGTVVASPKFQLPYYSATGTASTLTGDPSFTTDGSGHVSTVSVFGGSTSNGFTMQAYSGGVGSALYAGDVTPGLNNYTLFKASTTTNLNANSGGSINLEIGGITGAVLNGSGFNTTIGATTPAAGTFTNLKSTAFNGPNGILYSSTSPTIASGFGTSPALLLPNGTATFLVQVGTGGTASSGVLTFPAAATGWDCIAQQQTVSSTAMITTAFATSTTSVAVNVYAATGLAGAWTASDYIEFECKGR